MLERNVLRELSEKARSPIFLMLAGIVKLHSLKYQLIGAGQKTSCAISEITYSVPSYVNLPPLKLKLPVATNLLDTPVISISLGSK